MGFRFMALACCALWDSGYSWIGFRTHSDAFVVGARSENRTDAQPLGGRRLLQGKALILDSRFTWWLVLATFTCGAVSWVLFMFPAAQGGQGIRLPPRWDPSMEQSLPFRTWMQDLMLWTICTDMEPHQQCAAIISQLGGAARELARNITPQEVYNGGMINGVQLDPVSFLLHGLQMRFAPLDEETRLRATQDLLAFARRPGESIDALISRFELTRARARNEGGGTLGVETASLLLLRACGVNTQQFQVLTQPFGLRLPTTEAELAQMCHHLRRMGHIVERHPQSIATGLRGPQSSQQAFVAEADTGSSAGGEATWHSEAPSFGMGQWSGGDPSDWAFAAVQTGDGVSDTDSATSSDNDAPMDVGDLQGMSNAQADEYLFGEYQHAKRRWRRFTGKPVRALRKVVKRKGKGKGKSRNSYLNLSDVLQQSAYFKGKGKGGRASGKGFGRRTNPCGRDGEPLKCRTCGSAYHLRARCPRRPDASSQPSQPASTGSSMPPGSRSGPSFAVEATAGMRFAAFDSDESWSRVQTPRSSTSSFQHVQRPSRAMSSQQAQPEPVPQPNLEAPQAASSTTHHQMTPDPWMTEPDPWMEWTHNEQAASASASQAAGAAQPELSGTARSQYSGVSYQVPSAFASSAAALGTQVPGYAGPQGQMPSSSVGIDVYNANSWSLPGFG